MALENFHDKAKNAWHIKHNKARLFGYLFNSRIKEADSINVALKYSLLKVINKKLGEEETLFNCFEESWI